MSALEPIHPGQIVRSQCLEAYGLSVAEGARLLGVTRQTLNNLVNGHCGVSAEMALRLAKAFNGEAEDWLQHQLAYDLAQAKKRAHTLQVLPVGSPPVQRQTRLL